MAEYIERNSAMEKILEIGDLNYDGMPAKIGTTHAALIIRNLPAAAVAPVRHGCWGKFSVSNGIILRVRCSCCAGTQPLTFENMQYCPNCGALMDEGEENG